MKTSLQQILKADICGGNYKIINNHDEKYKAVTENLVHAFFLINTNGCIVDANTKASTLFGYTATELSALKTWQLIEDKDLLSVFQQEKGEVRVFETIGITKSNTRFPIEISATYFIDTDGVGKHSTMISDITQRKKAEAALQLSYERYNLVVKATKDLVWDWDLVSGEIYRSGHNLLDVYGHSSNEFIKRIKDWSEHIHPQDKEKIKAKLDYYIHSPNEKDFTLEYRFRKEDGNYVYINDKGYIIRNAAGKATRMIGAAEDITNRKIAEQKVQASEEKYRYLFNNNPATIIIWDIDTLEILEVNQSAIDLYGYSINEFLELKIHNLTTDEDNTACHEYIKKIKKYKNEKMTFDCRHRTKKGSTVVMEIKSHEIAYKNKFAILSIGNNITEKVQLEKSLNEERQLKQQQITEAVINGQEKERTELGQELHDNINQILASTKLYIECAMRDETPRPDLLRESKSLIEKAMFELRMLSKSLLPPSLGDTGLKQALQELIDHIIQVNNLTIKFTWQIADENELSKKLKLTIFRIVQEQLNNVIKHANAKSIIINITETENQIEMLLSDDGLGFNTSLKRNGVGLRNITSRAEMNNGKVSIISNPGEGCQLLVKFPVMKMTPATEI